MTNFHNCVSPPETTTQLVSTSYPMLPAITTSSKQPELTTEVSGRLRFHPILFYWQQTWLSFPANKLFCLLLTRKRELQKFFHLWNDSLRFEIVWSFLVQLKCQIWTKSTDSFLCVFQEHIQHQFYHLTQQDMLVASADCHIHWLQHQVYWDLN